MALELGELLGAGLGALALELGGAVAGLLGQALLGALAGLALAVHVGGSAALGVAGAGVGLVDGQAGLFALAPGLLVQAGLFLAGVLAQLQAHYGDARFRRAPRLLRALHDRTARLA